MSLTRFRGNKLRFRLLSFISCFEPNLEQSSKSWGSRMYPGNKPSSGWSTLNVDGSHVADERTGGSGMVLRNDTGAIIFSTCCFLHSCRSPTEAEIATCLEGTSLTLQRTNMSLIIELDFKEGVDALSGRSINRSSLAGMVEETKSLLHVIQRHCFVHGRRSANGVTHCMAQMGRCSQRRVVWLGARPDDLCKICENECNIIS